MKGRYNYGLLCSFYLAGDVLNHANALSIQTSIESNKWARAVIMYHEVIYAHDSTNFPIRKNRFRFHFLQPYFALKPKLDLLITFGTGVGDLIRHTMQRPGTNNPSFFR